MSLDVCVCLSDTAGLSRVLCLVKRVLRPSDVARSPDFFFRLLATLGGTADGELVWQQF